MMSFGEVAHIYTALFVGSIIVARMFGSEGTGKAENVAIGNLAKRTRNLDVFLDLMLLVVDYGR